MQPREKNVSLISKEEEKGESQYKVETHGFCNAGLVQAGTVSCNLRDAVRISHVERLVSDPPAASRQLNIPIISHHYSLFCLFPVCRLSCSGF